MNADKVIEQGKSIGLTIKRCHDPDYLEIDCGEALNPNERMRMTTDGGVLIVREGRYWQVGTVENVATAVKERTQ